ncbi:hypothetical protein PGT21_014963 [Puccinia graminis f. sp. tritici]|uniref:Uncharacterized protein n=1 Tax=Puccinia graminis f. sp. tritici TaxID=56615 RepID=A0A5B0LRP6_PUCGR|nr:hypothetical protein PGTUg99_012379 [Puccinia graminis f. sp. tritici]KAA1071671.1 hypothetical protein PGT21_014963 [Puccinia graminis f. sp. tritici]
MVVQSRINSQRCFDSNSVLEESSRRLIPYFSYLTDSVSDPSAQFLVLANSHRSHLELSIV